MNKRFIDLTETDFVKIPKLSNDHFCIGVERIYIHLYNQKKMHWYLAEYGPIGKKFFGFYEDKSNGICSGFCTLEDLKKWSEKGSSWEPLVDENWTVVAANEIPSLRGYIQMMIASPD